MYSRATRSTSSKPTVSTCNRPSYDRRTSLLSRRQTRLKPGRGAIMKSCSAYTPECCRNWTKRGMAFPPPLYRNWNSATQRGQQRGRSAWTLSGRYKRLDHLVRGGCDPTHRRLHRSVVGEAPVDRHQAGAIEQLHFRAVTDDGRALGLELLPGTAELAVADTPGAGVELGQLAPPESHCAAVGIEPDPVGALACRVTIDQGLARKDPQERLARGGRKPCRAKPRLPARGHTDRG